MSATAGAPRPASLYPQMRPIRNGRTREEVSRSQRGRLFAATIATVAERGYEASTVMEVCLRAGVSKKTLYEHFPTKQALFLSTCDLVCYRAIKRVGDNYAAEGGGVCVQLDYLAGEPGPARDACLEILTFGRGGAEHGFAMLDELAGRLAKELPPEGRAPREVLALARALVGAIDETVRHYTARGTPCGKPGAIIP